MELASRPVVILTGTDPSTRRGGISNALVGYQQALDLADIKWISIPSHNPETFLGKLWPWLIALMRFVGVRARMGSRCIVYCHAGAWPSLLREGLLGWWARILGFRVVIHLHAQQVDRYLSHRGGRLFMRFCLGSTHGVIVLSNWWKQRIQDALGSRLVTVIPNPFVLPEPNGNPQAQDGDQPLTVLAMTRLVEGKGVEYLISAIGELGPGWRLVIAGDGRFKPTLCEQVRSLGLAHQVEFVGWVSGEEKENCFARADIFCLPSYHDSYGMGFVEAMGRGLPVVTSDHPPLMAIVPDGVVGYCVNGRLPHQIADGLSRLTERSHRNELGRRGRAWVEQEFSIGKVATALTRVFTDLATE